MPKTVSGYVYEKVAVHHYGNAASRSENPWLYDAHVVDDMVQQELDDPEFEEYDFMLEVERALTK